ncbi:MAG: hypothetical protein MI739_11825 [Bacteroidales bacterium]|nr:hypothetical protein [Bacteroidales bacterium]
MVAKKIEDNIKKFLDKKNLKADRRLIIFLFFVLLSTIFWFLNQLDKEYETEITLPIRYNNFPSNKILVNRLPEHFNLRVKAHGYKLLEYKLSNKFLPFPVNINNLALKFNSKSQNKQLYALTQNLNMQIKRWLDSDLEILDVSPDSLYFNFSDKAFKKVAVKSNLEIIPATQYMVRGRAVFSPDSIVISGAKLIIDTINEVFVVERNLVELTSDYEEDIELKEINAVGFSKEKVNLSVNIEKFTEGSQKVKLEVINVPDSIILRTFPNEITVSYFVALSDYEKVLPQLFEAVIDYNDKNDQQDGLNVKIINRPEYISSLRFNPAKVEYIIEKK